MWISNLNTTVTISNLPGQGNGTPAPPSTFLIALESGLTDIMEQEANLFLVELEQN